MKKTKEQSKLLAAYSREGYEYTKSADYEEGIIDGANWAIENFGGIQWNKYPDVKPPTPNGHYLVIAPRSSPKNCMALVAEWYEDDGPFYDEASECPLDDVTHWAEINLPNQ